MADVNDIMAVHIWRDKIAHHAIRQCVTGGPYVLWLFFLSFSQKHTHTLTHTHTLEPLLKRRKSPGLRVLLVAFPAQSYHSCHT